MVRALAKGAETARARRDLKAVESELESLRGQPMTGAIEHLMTEKPRARKAAAPNKGRGTKKAAKKAAKRTPVKKPRKAP